MFVKAAALAAALGVLAAPAHARTSFQSLYPSAELATATVAKPAEFPAAVQRVSNRLRSALDTGAVDFAVTSGPVSVDYTWRTDRVTASRLVFEKSIPKAYTRSGRSGGQYRALVPVDSHTVAQALAPGKRQARTAAMLIAARTQHLPAAIEQHVRAHAPALLAWMLVTKLNVLAPTEPLPGSPLDLVEGLSQPGFDPLAYVGFSYGEPGCLEILPSATATGPVHVTLSTTGPARVLGIDPGSCPNPTITEVGYRPPPPGPRLALRVANRLERATGEAVQFVPHDALEQTQGATATVVSWGNRGVLASRAEYSRPVARQVLAEIGGVRRDGLYITTGYRYAQVWTAPSAKVVLSAGVQGPSALRRAIRAVKALTASDPVVPAASRYSQRYTSELVATQLIERASLLGLQDFPSGVSDYLAMAPDRPSAASPWAYVTVANPVGACLQITATSGPSRPIRMLLDVRPGGFSQVLDATYGSCS